MLSNHERFRTNAGNIVRKRARCLAELDGFHSWKSSPSILIVLPAARAVKSVAGDRQLSTPKHTQARNWLNADLARWTKQDQAEKREWSAGVSQAIQHWKVDSDLAGTARRGPAGQAPSR
jgi:hypothetical protein